MSRDKAVFHPDKAAFLRGYVRTFLATYAAAHYDDNCLRGWPVDSQPIEDANHLAEEAWEQICTL